MNKLFVIASLVSLLAAPSAFARPACKIKMPVVPQKVIGATASYEEMRDARMAVVKYHDDMWDYMEPSCHVDRNIVYWNRAEHLLHETVDSYNAQLRDWLAIPANFQLNESYRHASMALVAVTR